jgi:Flp pilus assembly protein TadG
MTGFGRRATQLSSAARRFRDDDGGNVAIIFAISAIVLMLCIGAAVDIGRWLHARSATLSAIDAAVLAGGRTMQVTHGDKAAAVAAATNYYNENVKTRLPVTDDTVVFTTADNGMGLTAQGNAYIKTPFLQFANVSKLPLISLAQTKFGSNLGMKTGETEISVMLDVTGSMAGSKLTSLKSSAQKLVDIVTTANQDAKYKTRIAIVPFSEDIRMPDAASYQAATGKPPKVLMVKSGKTQTIYNRSELCLVERTTSSSRYNDDAPSTNNYPLPHRVQMTTLSTDDGTFLIDGKSSNTKGEVVTVSWANGTKLSSSQKSAIVTAANKFADCTVPANAAVQPLTTDTTVLSTKIKNLSATGGTAGHLGTTWAWFTLSPNWNTLWSSDSDALEYAPGSDKLKKVAILMTDGDYNTQYDANGVSANYGSTSSCPQAANACSAVQAASLCTNMKAKGIEVWTVGFDVGKTSLAAQTLKACATDETKYYNAADGDDLENAFTDIAVKLTTVYLSK